MRIAHVVPDTDAEGPGRRFALWTQGCSLRCKGCCNPELFGPGGTERSVDDLLAEITSTPGIEGVSLLGGEPTEQSDLLALCAGVQAAGLTVMLYSGHLRETIEARHPGLLDHVDLLVDGPFDVHQRDDSRRWIGSRNQRLHVLSSAYTHDDPRFATAQTVEIRFDADGLVVNGWPDLARKVAR
ncbi:MAG: radical SAM protein [Myxococcales bacterium]|nr:radical SAM protein [Myxococcales bacterium]MCB9671214.1 radical SAM protein [Alphaproteobacteria bacterium]